MNAIKYLLREHNKFRKMLSAIAEESHRYETKKKMFDNLTSDLTHHEKMEELVWYPYLKSKAPLASTIKHLVSEEKTAEKEIFQIEAVDDEEEWDEKFIKFKKDVEHHAREEEKSLFPKVAKFLDEQELKDIGNKMQKFKKTLEIPSKIKKKIFKS
ncbi:MAG TPA: hemerythrin domain-containing protein [Gammaproteobacteria bacterium]|nr:hemerythrin domain-containing protein [Gammaproteobacteria bacterium]